MNEGLEILRSDCLRFGDQCRDNSFYSERDRKTWEDLKLCCKGISWASWWGNVEGTWA